MSDQEEELCQQLNSHTVVWVNLDKNKSYSGCGESDSGPARIYFFLLKDISESTGLRKFKPSKLEWDFFKVYFHMYFDPQRSFVAYIGLVIFKFSFNFLERKSDLWPNSSQTAQNFQKAIIKDEC